MNCLLQIKQVFPACSEIGRHLHTYATVRRNSQVFDMVFNMTTKRRATMAGIRTHDLLFPIVDTLPLHPAASATGNVFSEDKSVPDYVIDRSAIFTLSKILSRCFSTKGVVLRRATTCLPYHILPQICGLMEYNNCFPIFNVRHLAA
jgi:hypothetical protein